MFKNLCRLSFVFAFSCRSWCVIATSQRLHTNSFLVNISGNQRGCAWLRLVLQPGWKRLWSDESSWRSHHGSSRKTCLCFRWWNRNDFAAKMLWNHAEFLRNWRGWRRKFEKARMQLNRGSDSLAKSKWYISHMYIFMYVCMMYK